MSIVSNIQIYTTKKKPYYRISSNNSRGAIISFFTQKVGDYSREAISFVGSHCTSTLQGGDKGREDGKRSKWGDYMREAINQGTAIIIILFEEIRRIHSVTLFSYLHKD